MSLNGQGAFNNRSYDLTKRYQQQQQQAETSDKSEKADSKTSSSSSAGRTYESTRTNSVPDTTPTETPSTNKPAEAKTFFTSLDDLNQMIDQEQQKATSAQNMPYAASLKQLDKLNKWLDKDTIPAIDDIQFDAFGQLDANSEEGQEINQKLEAFLQRLANSGKAGKLRANQIKAATNIDLLNAQNSLLSSVLANTAAGAPELADLQARLNAVNSLLQQNQDKLDQLNDQDPSKGTRVNKKVFNDNDEKGNGLSSVELYNRARQWAMKVLKQYS